MKHNHNKCLIGVWALGSLILINHFGSDLQALEVSEQTFKIESIQQLIDRQDIDVMVPKNSNYDRLLRKVSWHILTKFTLQPTVVAMQY